MNEIPFPRYIMNALDERLRVMPAVVVTGARQTGKSTLVKGLTPQSRSYSSLDDIDVFDLARRNPEALVGGASNVTLDEVQREPNLLLAVKQAIDSKRQPGRFLLTGSANLLLMQRISESLAGRASYLTLWPMTRREQLKLGLCGLWEGLVAAKDSQWPDLLHADKSLPEDWQPFARRGGFPTPAIQLTGADDRMIWFDGYVRTYLERDLQMLSSIAALPDFRRLMRAACFRLGQLVNQTEMARDLSLKQPTIYRYLNLLETSYLLVRLPAYSVNRTKRLLKSPKLYWGDVGLAMHLSGMAEPTGAYLENIVLLDLLVWQSGRLTNTEILYWRTTAGDEVDLVIETEGKVLPIEIKSTNRPRIKDAANLIAFQNEYGADARAGLLLHTGTAIEWLTPRVLAAPWWKVL
ncbi:MAG: ATP-binding protein [Deltaproteobacteria bacterium]|nr:ATP-binding protein [Deltaproteobacteria bacterium]